MRAFAAASLAQTQRFVFGTRVAMRTGGPQNDNDGDDEDALVRRLMPIMAAVIIFAFIFS